MPTPSKARPLRCAELARRSESGVCGTTFWGSYQPVLETPVRGAARLLLRIGRTRQRGNFSPGRDATPDRPVQNAVRPDEVRRPVRKLSRVLSFSTGVGISHSLSMRDVPAQTSSKPIERSKNRSARSRNSPGKTSRLDQNPDHLFHVRRIHKSISCSRTYDDGSWKTPVCLSVLSAVGEIVAGQIDDDLHAAIRQNAFAAVGKPGRAAVPQ